MGRLGAIRRRPAGRHAESFASSRTRRPAAPMYDTAERSAASIAGSASSAASAPAMAASTSPMTATIVCDAMRTRKVVGVADPRHH